MADKASSRPVIVTLTCDAKPGTEIIQVDRDKWSRMTPSERAGMLDEDAHRFMADQGGYGWTVHGADAKDAA